MIREIIVKNVKVNPQSIAKRMRLSESEDIEKIELMCKQAEAIAVPKAIFKVSYITDKNEDKVTIDTIAFNSKLMYKNFLKINRVFPFIASCGREIYDWANTFDDVFERYWADYIMEYILRDAIKELYSGIKGEFGIEKLSSMNPGSLEGWPIEQQTDLFNLLDDDNIKTGVELTDTYLMVPQKSVSGILFPSNSDYVNCKLCDREHCPSRKAPFNQDLKNELG